MLIDLIRHIDAKRNIVSNYQVGVRLLRGLQYPLMFPAFSHVGVYSPTLMRALIHRTENTLQNYGRVFCYMSCAANLGLSIEDRTTTEVLWQAMDCLESSAGEAINQYATDKRLHLVQYA